LLDFVSLILLDMRFCCPTHGDYVIVRHMMAQDIKSKIIPVLREYGVESAALFGSAARGEETPESDVDILVSIKRPIGVYEFIGLQFDLEKVLGRKVDLVSKNAVNKYIKPYIEKDLTPIYER
jgi:uncharacterized protein